MPLLTPTTEEEIEIKRILGRLETITPNGNDISPFLDLLNNVDLDDLPDNCHWIIKEGISDLEELHEKDPTSGEYNGKCNRSYGKRCKLKEIRDSIRGHLAAKMVEFYQWKILDDYEDEAEEDEEQNDGYHGGSWCNCCTIA